MNSIKALPVVNEFLQSLTNEEKATVDLINQKEVFDFIQGIGESKLPETAWTYYQINPELERQYAMQQEQKNAAQEEGFGMYPRGVESHILGLSPFGQFPARPQITPASDSEKDETL